MSVNCGNARDIVHTFSVTWHTLLALSPAENTPQNARPVGCVSGVYPSPERPRFPLFSESARMVANALTILMSDKDAGMVV